MELPVYELKINEVESEVDFIALVDMPAIERDFLAFNQKQVFTIDSEEQRIISGPLMLADKLIYRNSQDFGEHYVRFTKETIKKIAIRYAQKGYQKNVNIMHEDQMKIDGVVLFESFITDCGRGICAMKGFEDAPDGSWFGSMYVNNEAAWQAVKENKLRGFSVEGFFDYAKPVDTAEQILQKLSALLSPIIPN